MKKCMNGKEKFVEESLAGIVQAYPDFYELCDSDCRGVIHRGNENRRVSIVTGGGYGHLPLFLGYVGDGLCDGIAVGNVFTSPSSETIKNVAMSLRNQEGVLFLFGNYFGDSMNFEMASELLELEGITSAIVKGADDIASAPADRKRERRGIAGIVFAYKIAGAAADRGLPLAEVERIAGKAAERISSFGVSFSSCTLPGEEKPIFEIDSADMEVGMGIHGEPGIRRMPLKSARELAEELVPAVLEDAEAQKGDRIAVLVNGLGSTSREELYLLYHEMKKMLDIREIVPVKVYVGEYAASMEMAGLSVSVIRLDDELEALLGQEAYSPMVQL